MTSLRHSLQRLNGLNNNDKKPSQSSVETTPSEHQREAFYRACIAEFQQLGYQDQYLAELTDELIPLTGLEPLSDKEKTTKG